MTPDKNELRKLIEAEIIGVEKLVVEYQEEARPIAPENAIGRVSRMDAINNKAISEAALRKAEAKRANLQYALSRIDEPDFGVCAKCQVTIPYQRLLLVPQSRFCVNCAG